VEQGSHQQLLDAGGVYADMWRAQAAEIRGSANVAESSTEEGDREGALLEPLPALSDRAMRS
jgi:hypothetical protein